MPGNESHESGGDGWKYAVGTVIVAGVLFGTYYLYEESLEPLPPKSPTETSLTIPQRIQSYLSAFACNSSPLEVVKVDCDSDGISNVADITPLRADAIDVDLDGIPNMRDPQPYVKNQYTFNVNVQPSYVVKPEVTLPPKQNQQNIYLYDPYADLARDADNDFVPDYLDRFNGNDYGDSDSDGVSNARDPRPYDSDRDRDGDPDGYDKNPTDPNRGRQAEQRLQEQRERDRADQARRDLDAAEERRREQNRR